MYTTTFLSSSTNTINTGPYLMVFGLVLFVVALYSIIVAWRVNTKAGRPGWAAIIPFYNVYIILKIIGRPGWWLILFLIPVVNLIISIIIALDMAKVFGKSSVFGVIGLWLFSIIGYSILAFGKATYVGPGGGGSAAAGGTPLPGPPLPPAQPTMPAAQPLAPPPVPPAPAPPPPVLPIPPAPATPTTPPEFAPDPTEGASRTMHDDLTGQ